MKNFGSYGQHTIILVFPVIRMTVLYLQHKCSVFEVTGSKVELLELPGGKANVKI